MLALIVDARRISGENAGEPSILPSEDVRLTAFFRVGVCESGDDSGTSPLITDILMDSDFVLLAEESFGAGVDDGVVILFFGVSISDESDFTSGNVTKLSSGPSSKASLITKQK
jgi:hypothetical protein